MPFLRIDVHGGPVKRALKTCFTAIGKAQSFVILSLVYYLLCLPFFIIGRRALQVRGWIDSPSHTVTLEEATRQ